MSTEPSVLDLTAAVWCKSSRSSAAGANGNCVEVARTGLAWRKSSRSSAAGANGACVEVAFTGPAVAVRDSKNPDGPALAFPATSWAHFLNP